MTPTPLVAISPGDGRDLDAWLEALAGAGLGTILLREPQQEAGALHDQAAAAARLGLQVVLHDKNAAARRIAAEGGFGLHLPAGSDPADLDGGIPGPIGVSCHSEAEAEAALAAGASYVFLGPVWRPTSKPEDDRPVLGPARFLAFAAGRPVWALGGITPQRWAVLRRGGATGAAVLGDLFEAHAPELAAARVQQFLSLG